MHLGRFHNVVWEIQFTLGQAGLTSKLEACAAALDHYGSTKAEAQLQEFRVRYAELLAAASHSQPELDQPYALDVIEQLGLSEVIPPRLAVRLDAMVKERAFDHAGIAADFRSEVGVLTKLITHLQNITTAFNTYKVELEVVVTGEAEVGLLLPRSIIGETIPELTSEFAKFGKLFRAVNELTGAPDYDPRIRTISSSDWQIFLDLSPEQIAVWVMMIERIIGLFKTNLEIKSLQQALATKNMPQDITDRIGEEVDKRVAGALEKLADEIILNNSRIEDVNRRNEVQIQLRQGVRHLAKRIHQGAKVEINVAIPDDEEALEGAADGAALEQGLIEQMTAHRERIAQLRALNLRAKEASNSTIRLDHEPQAMLRFFGADEGDPPT